MNYYRTRLKNFLEWWKNSKLFKTYKNRDVNEFFWHTYVSGGILSTEKVNRRWKVLWLMFQGLSCTVVVSLNIYGFLHGEEKNLSTVLLLFRPIIMLCTIYFTHALFCYFRESLERYADKLDEYITILGLSEYENGPFQDIFRDILLFLPLCYVSWAKGFEFYFPMLTKYSTLSVPMNFLSSVALALAALPVIAITINAQRLKYIFMKGLMRTSDEILRQMRISSNSTLKDLESSHSRELAIEERTPHQRIRVKHLFIERRNKICDNFNSNLIHFMKHHQKIVNIHLTIRNFFEIVASLVVARTSFLLIVLSNDIIQAFHHPTQLDDYWPVTELVFLVFLIYDLYTFCKVNSAIRDAVEHFSNEAYSCPWYLTTVKSRRLFLLMMTQMQNVPRLRIFGTFPIDMPLMPRVFNFVYTYVSVLQVLLQRSK